MDARLSVIRDESSEKNKNIVMNSRAIEYILDQLNDLFIRFDGIKIRYEYNEILYTDMIELLSWALYENNQEYR